MDALIQSEPQLEILAGFQNIQELDHVQPFPYRRRFPAESHHPDKD